MKTLRFVKQRLVLLCLLPLAGLALLLTVKLSSKGTNKTQNVVIITPSTVLSPLVKQLSSTEQCREWEQVEQVRKRMMELLRKEDKENINRVLQLGRMIFA